MSLNADAVRRLATLARLDLDPAEQAALQADLNAVLGLIDRLQFAGPFSAAQTLKASAWSSISVPRPEPMRAKAMAIGRAHV